MLVRQLDRRFDHHLAQEVAHSAAADLRDAFAAQAEHFARLRLGRNFELYAPIERGHLKLAIHTPLAEVIAHPPPQGRAFGAMHHRPGQACHAQMRRIKHTHEWQDKGERAYR